MTMTESEIYENVKSIVVDALSVEEDEVSPESRLTDDLGAESIDYLDIFFRIEKTFDITIERDELMVASSISDEYVDQSKITDAGMEELRKRFPYASLDTLDETRNVGDFLRVFTVDTLVKIVTDKLLLCQPSEDSLHDS